MILPGRLSPTIDNEDAIGLTTETPHRTLTE
jgi:hypothetical protein